MNPTQGDIRGFISDIDDELEARGLRRRELGGTWSDAAALEARVADLEKRCKLLEHHYAPMKPRAGDVSLVNLVDVLALVNEPLCTACAAYRQAGEDVPPCCECIQPARGLPSRFTLREELR